MTTTPTIKPVPSTPQFRWNSVAKRYIGTNGKFVSQIKVRDALDTFITDATRAMKSLSDDLIRGSINLAQWQTEMMVLSKDVNLAGAALERGGWYNMTQSDFGRVGRKIRDEYGYIQNFSNQIASGQQRLDGTLWNRATLYGDQGRVTYYQFAQGTAFDDGMDEERSHLSPADHCDSCVDEEAKGWRPIGTLKPIGSRSCLSRCHCYMTYRNSRTGASRTV